MGIPAYNDLERMASVFRVFEGYENLLVPQQIGTASPSTYNPIAEKTDLTVFRFDSKNSRLPRFPVQIVQVPDADYAVIQDDHEEEEHDFPDVMSRYLRAQRDLAENTAIHRQEGNREIAVEGSWDDDVEAQEEVSDRETGVLSGLSDLIDAVREASRDNDERIEDAYEIVNEDLPMAGDTDESAFDDNEAVFVDVDQPVDENLVEAVNMGQGTDNNVAEEQASNAIVVEVVHTGDRHPNDSVEEQHAPHINIEEDIQPNADHNISGPAQAAPHEQIFDLFAFDDKTLPPRRPTPNISNEAWDDIWHILSDPEVVNRGGVFHLPSDNENGNVLMLGPSCFRGEEATIKTQYRIEFHAALSFIIGPSFLDGIHENESLQMRIESDRRLALSRGYRAIIVLLRRRREYPVTGEQPVVRMMYWVKKSESNPEEVKEEEEEPTYAFVDQQPDTRTIWDGVDMDGVEIPEFEMGRTYDWDTYIEFLASLRRGRAFNQDAYADHVASRRVDGVLLGPEE